MKQAAVNTPSVVSLPDVTGLDCLTDEALLELQRDCGAVRRRVDAVLSAISGEIVRRSAPALGHSGLAARMGASTPQKAVQQLTGVSLSEAKTLVVVGEMVTAQDPWLAPVNDAIDSGELSAAQAAAIARGLGAPSADVAADDLLDAATHLVEFARDSSAENTAIAARQHRERLDVARASDLEAHRRSKRSLTWSTQHDGTTRLTAVLDPESAAIVVGAVETIIGPRRGGPRFLAADQHRTSEQDRAAPLDADTRTTAQLALDALVDIVRLANRAESADLATLFGVRSPAVRVHVQAADLKQGDGFAYIEGQGAFVSSATARRIACETGWLPVLFDGAASIDVGATQRLHSPRQRVAAASYWNGCAWGDCERPPAMTEMHHIERWNGRNTTLANGITLCRFHHMELHANQWCITDTGEGPVARSQTGRSVPLRPKVPFAASAPGSASESGSGSTSGSTSGSGTASR